MVFIPRPDAALLKPAYVPLVAAFEEEDAMVLLRDQGAQFLEIWKKVPSEKRRFAYAAGKWTVQQVIQHLVDVERIFGYRALCVARGETLALPPFDENHYAANDDSTTRSWEDVLEEWEVMRKATLSLLKGMSPESLNRVGIVGNSTMSAASIAWFIAGHAQHHRKVLKERYAIG